MEELANATTPVGMSSQFPQDLEATTSIIGRTVDFLMDDLDSLTPSQLSTVRQFLNVTLKFLSMSILSGLLLSY